MFYNTLCFVPLPLSVRGLSPILDFAARYWLMFYGWCGITQENPRFVLKAKNKYGHSKPSSPKGVCHDHSNETKGYHNRYGNLDNNYLHHC